MLRVLNMQRELWKVLDRPVVIWLPESCLQLIARHASDFWSWRSGVFELVMPEMQRMEIAEARNWDNSGNYLDIPDAEIPVRIETLTNLWTEIHEDGELPRKQWETGFDIAQQLIVLHGHRGEFDGINIGDAGQGHDRRAHSAESHRRGVRDQRQAARRQRLETQLDQNGARDRHRRAEAGGPLEKRAERERD